MTTAELESRLFALQAEVAELRARQERLELDAIERRGDNDVARGQTVPARQSLETFRQKRNIPRP